MSATKLTIKRFLGEFHEGTMNRIFHIVGFFLLTIGIWRMDWIVIVLAIITQEIGHIYQHLVIKKRSLHFRLFDILRWQTVVGGLTFLLYAAIVLIIKKIIYGNY